MKKSCARDPSDRVRSWLALRSVRGVGPVLYQGLLRAFGDPVAVLAASAHALECAGVRPEVAAAIRAFGAWPAVDEQLARLARCGAEVVTWDEPRYPVNLRQVHDPPPVLFVRGTLLARDTLAVAIVGSRAASAHGLRMARLLAEGLAAHGLTVVSGLARGTDAEAHWAALGVGGRTLAVFGSGVDMVYPPEHRRLARDIAAGGALVSELPPGSKPDAENFPARNRIISGLALGTVVVEAADRSGSLITARCAAEQGREVFAVPGPVGERTRGTHRLIREGAKLTESVNDILEELAPQFVRSSPAPATAPRGLAPTEAAVVAVLGPRPQHVDSIIARSGLPASAVLPTLLQLELTGVVEQLPGKHFLARGVDGPAALVKEEPYGEEPGDR
jgi:DNA processing protein